MERVRISNLEPGQVFEEAMYSLQGQKLINAGVPLNARHVEAIRRSGVVEVIIAQSVQELVDAGVLAEVDSRAFAVGDRARHGVLSETGQVVLEEGEEIEAHHLDALAEGGGAYYAKQRSQQRRERILLADALVDDLNAQAKFLERRVEAAATCTWLSPGDPTEWPEPEALTRWRNQRVERLRRLYARIEAGVDVRQEEFEPLVDDLADRLARFPTRFTQLALLCPRREDYLPDHCFTTTVLAMAMAAQLCWPLEDARRVGLAGLFYDLGMLLVPERIRTGACELTDIDRARVQRHPIFSLAMMESLDEAHPILQLTALQHHERENGTGYPQGLRREAVCDYARVIAVADAFAATTEPRHYRRQKLPYMAMEETLHSTSALALWKPAVRSLLQAAGLFPVGSYVKLSDGKHAHVLASNPEQLDRPTVQPLTRGGEPEGEPIDLAVLPKSALSVTRPLFGPQG